MDRRTLVEFITSCILIICGGVITILPILNIEDIKIVFITILIIYGVIHLVKNLLIMKTKEYSGIKTFIASVITLIIMLFLDVTDSPWNLALILFIWVILMSLIKLKESDYYHDNKNKLWKLNIINLVIFIIVGILTTINLYYTGDIQILVIGFFFLINGILELMDPLVAYIIEKK